MFITNYSKILISNAYPSSILNFQNFILRITNFIKHKLKQQKYNLKTLDDYK